MPAKALNVEAEHNLAIQVVWRTISQTGCRKSRHFCLIFAFRAVIFVSFTHFCFVGWIWSPRAAEYFVRMICRRKAPKNSLEYTFRRIPQDLGTFVLYLFCFSPKVLFLQPRVRRRLRQNPSIKFPQSGSINWRDCFTGIVLFDLRNRKTTISWEEDFRVLAMPLDSR